uniref:Pco120819c n=1 Tax=Arundo donax TaxID=35708 RepID=A0A0A9DDC2_ARUDO
MDCIMFPSQIRWFVHKSLTAVQLRSQNVARKTVLLGKFGSYPSLFRHYTDASSAVATDGVVATLLCRLHETEAAALCKVLLVVLLCPVEPPCREDLGDDRPVQKFLLLLQGFSCRFLLLWGVVVDP